MLAQLVLVAGCAGEASHVPPLWQLPGAAIGAAASNAAYAARRARVRAAVEASLPGLLARRPDATESVLSAARIAPDRRAEAIAALDAELMRPVADRAARIEGITVVLMVHGA